MAKSYKFYSLLIILLIFACNSQSLYFATQIDTPSSIEGISLLDDFEVSDPKILELLTYADKSYEWRKSSNSIFQRIDAYQKAHDGKILSKDLLHMHETTALYVRRVRQPLINIMGSQFFHMDLRREIQLLENKETFVEHNVIFYQDNSGFSSPNKSDLPNDEDHQKIKINIYHINPNDQKGQDFLKIFNISLAASLLLLDNYAVGLDPYFNNKDLRRSLLYDIPDRQWEIRNTIKNIWLNYENFHRSSKLIEAVQIYSEAKLITHNQTLLSASPYSNELDTLIQKSLAFQEIKGNPSKENFLHYFLSKLSKRPRDEIYRIRFHSTSLLSKIFVKSISVVKLGEGKLNNLPKAEFNNITSMLRPLDILLEKTAFRLTDKFVPGYYGHTAIWVGTEVELKKMGVWDLLPHYYKIAKERYSYVGPSFQDSIRRGKHIIEALRTGVEINSLRHFLDINDLVVIRGNTCKGNILDSQPCFTLDAKRKYLIEAFKQIGKNYDFNFDANTEAELTCSEVAYRTFFDIDFNATKILGKFSINPDQIVQSAVNESDYFRPILIYFKGKKVSGNTEELRNLLRLIINKEINAAEAMVGINNFSK